MPYTQPSADAVHANVPLTNVAIAYMQATEAFVASRVFPVISVTNKSNSYIIYNRGDFNRLEMKPRAPSSKSAGGGFRISRDAYNTTVQSVHKDLDDQVMASQDSPIDLEMSAVRYVTGQALLRREVDWAQKYFRESVWSFNVVGSAARSESFDPRTDTNNYAVYWNNVSSTPIEDVRLLKRYFLEETGLMANTFTMGRPVFDTLVDHPDIVGRLDRGQTAGPVMATKDSLAALFEVERVLVMDGIRNSGEEGTAASHQFIGGKHALLSYRPESPGPMEASAGYTFEWTGYVGSVTDGVEITRFYIKTIKSTRIEAEVAYDQKVISPDLGVFLNGIVE